VVGERFRRKFAPPFFLGFFFFPPPPPPIAYFWRCLLSSVQRSSVSVIETINQSGKNPPPPLPLISFQGKLYFSAVLLVFSLNR